MNDYDKYRKYKKKYLDLRNDLHKLQHGGNDVLFPIEDEIHFWGRQMTEHLLFLHLGLEVTDLKNEALQIHNLWKKFMEQNFWIKGVESELDLIVLSKNDLAKIGNIDTNKVLELINSTEKYQQKVINILKTNEWIGWIFTSLAEHMQKETEYFKRKISGPKYNADEEIKFINQHHGEEMGATAQFIDPAPENNMAIEKARSYATKTMKNWSKRDLEILQGLDITEKATLLKISIKYSTELTKFAKETGMKIDHKQFKSIISPILAHHVYREFDRFTKTLEMLT